ncbi:hypothetical protein [Lentzea sp. NPDC003310]|uniref:hypothetical protein n=1 Tax=Lentzea sp. NPDC003310 TaxID=3154447 RepID=UPI0033BD3B49
MPVGIIPGGGGSVRLPRLVGAGLAADVLTWAAQLAAAPAAVFGRLSASAVTL